MLYESLKFRVLPKKYTHDNRQINYFCALDWKGPFLLLEVCPGQFSVLFPLIFCLWNTRKKSTGVLITSAKDSDVLIVLHRKVDDIIPVCSQLLA